MITINIGFMKSDYCSYVLSISVQFQGCFATLTPPKSPQAALAEQASSLIC